MAKKDKPLPGKEMVALEKWNEDKQAVDELYGDGMIYDIDRIENEIKFYQEQAGAALLEMGKRFIRIKAHEDHGRFMITLEKVGMAYRSAAYAMSAAKRFSNVPTLAHLDSSKLKALTVLEEEEIEELEKGGTVRGVPADKLLAMGTREMRETLRKNETQIERLKKTHREQEERHNKEVADLREELSDLRIEAKGGNILTKHQKAEKVAEWKAAEMKNDLFFKLVECNKILRDAEKVVQGIANIPNIAPETTDSIMAELGEYFDNAMESLLDLQEAWREFCPATNSRGLAAVAEAYENGEL